MKKNSPAPRSLLVVSATIDVQSSLQAILGTSTWDVQWVPRGSEAIQYLRSTGSRPVVLSEDKLPDCDWKFVVTELNNMAYWPRPIVFSANADERLWAEVLNWGAYDLLALPLDAKEVKWVTDSAWLSGTQRKPEHRSPGMNCIADGMAILAGA